MSYAVKEIFHSLQGEGANAGRATVFCRFAGCNLWSGREVDRLSASCRFCDTDFVGVDGTHGGQYRDASSLADAICGMWTAADAEHRFVVLTGGEPLLQVDPPLLEALRRHRFMVAVETNGTILPPVGIDWLCVSPKVGAALVVTQGQELKVVVPQAGLDLADLETLDFAYRFVQPMDGPYLADNTKWAIEWCLQHPAWRLSIQTHKVVGIR